MCSDTVAISVTDLSKTYLVYARPQDRLKQFICRGFKTFCTPFAALKPVNLEIRRGEAVGIIGRNGSGKSTLLQLISGTLNPTSGTVNVKGRVSALLELGAGFNPEFTGRENIYLNAAILGMSEAEIAARYDSIVAFSGIESHIDQPVKTYSSGMYVRLAFSVAIASNPDVLIVDEALAVGDEAFQRKCFARVRELLENGTTLLFVSHSARNVMDICTRAILLEEGELVAQGTPRAVLAGYHKLIYGPAAKKQEILSELRTKLPSEAEEILDGGAQVESTVVYESQGAVISNVRITTEDGANVNMLVRGRRYHYRFDVAFSEDADSVRFGMLIKTISGLNLGGASSHLEREAVSVKKGAVLQVDFGFTCQLLSGAYFTNAGCTGLKNGERTNLHRIVDALMFKVQAEEDQRATGTVDFGITCSVNGM